MYKSAVPDPTSCFWGPHVVPKTFPHTRGRWKFFTGLHGDIWMPSPVFTKFAGKYTKFSPLNPFTIQSACSPLSQQLRKQQARSDDPTTTTLQRTATRTELQQCSSSTAAVQQCERSLQSGGSCAHVQDCWRPIATPIPASPSCCHQSATA